LRENGVEFTEFRDFGDVLRGVKSIIW
jgi:hypothetical protein